MSKSDSKDYQCSLFIRNINFKTSTENLKDYFKQFGELKDAYLPINYHTKKKLGYGFIEFQHREDAEKAREETNGKEFDGSNLTVDFAKEGRKSPHSMRRKSGRYHESRRRRSYSSSRSHSRRRRSHDRDRKHRRNRDRSRSKSRTKSRSRSKSHNKRNSKNTKKKNTPSESRSASKSRDHSESKSRSNSQKKSSPQSDAKQYKINEEGIQW